MISKNGTSLLGGVIGFFPRVYSSVPNKRDTPNVLKSSQTCNPPLILVGSKKRNMGRAHVLIIGNISFWPVVNKSDRYLVMVAVVHITLNVM